MGAFISFSFCAFRGAIKIIASSSGKIDFFMIFSDKVIYALKV
jgi:hypothetical protein